MKPYIIYMVHISKGRNRENGRMGRVTLQLQHSFGLEDMFKVHNWRAIARAVES